MPGLLGDGKGPMDGAKDYHFAGPFQRGTNGSPERTYALSLGYSIVADAARLAAEYGTCSICHDVWHNGKTTCHDAKGNPAVVVPDPDFDLSEIAGLMEFLAHSWAGHAGWDMSRRIDMVEAATNVRTNPMVNGNAPDGSQ